jgi:hypothetical protein
MNESSARSTIVIPSATLVILFIWAWVHAVQNNSREQIEQSCSTLARMPRSSIHRVSFGSFVENHEACVRRRLRD